MSILNKEKEKITAKVLEKKLLSDKKKGSSRDIYHIEFIMIKNDKTNIKDNNQYYYEPGDSIRIVPNNTIKEVQKILNFFNLNINQENLINRFIKLNISHLSTNFLKNYSFLIKKNFSSNKEWKLYDLLRFIPPNKDFQLENLVKIIEPIKPRFYSISSSPKVNLLEIHISVLLDQFRIDGKTRYGHCSNFLSNLEKGEKITFSIHRNQSFKLPKNDENMILICSGTGIAPFRSFLYEREKVISKGKSWLFFGLQKRFFDFLLYQMEIKNWKKKGILSRVDFAFSRDQKNKIYVQDKIWENRIDFFLWIKSGAHIYICGKKKPMSLDVENTIFRIIKEVGFCNPEYFIRNMKKKKKYLKDVY
ncbi:flavodoxin domain-containing protein [Blattabacterium cuenoti]|uniref:hypothetical protein n=1 Tax=Blattabacterium cuenoti TaxID=1653831 RepID=UPI00163CE3EB|nr:hypothetical protein [Blattabacterium cuenoti]